VVTGGVVRLLHGHSAFNALTGQEWIAPVADIVREAERIRRQPEAPSQGDPFSDVPSAEEGPGKAGNA
jgi:hypothetical protein